MGKKWFKKKVDKLEKLTRQDKPLSLSDIEKYTKYKSSPFSKSLGGKWIMISLVVILGGVIFYFVNKDQDKSQQAQEQGQSDDDRFLASPEDK